MRIKYLHPVYALNHCMYLYPSELSTLFTESATDSLSEWLYGYASSESLITVITQRN